MAEFHKQLYMVKCQRSHIVLLLFPDIECGDRVLSMRCHEHAEWLHGNGYLFGGYSSCFEPYWTDIHKPTCKRKLRYRRNSGSLIRFGDIEWNRHLPVAIVQ